MLNTACTTRNTVNRIARKEPHFNHVVQERPRGVTNLHIELEKRKLDQIAARNIRVYLEERIAFSVKLKRLQRKTYEDIRYDIRDTYRLKTNLAIKMSL